MENLSDIISAIKTISNLTFENNDASIEVLSGDLSNSLFFLYKAKLLNDQTAYLRGVDIIQSSIENANTNIYNCKFAYGYPGIAWLLTFLKNQGILDEDFSGETQAYLEDIFLKSINQNGKIKFYDLFYGFIGKGVYFLERQDLSSLATESIIEIINLLDETKIDMGPNGIAWLDYYTSGHDLNPRKIKEYYNIGLSHGIPSIIIFLCRCIEKGIMINSCKRLINDSCKWILSLESKTYAPMLYPCKILLGKETYPIEDNKKIAWCYGDLGVSLAFANAAKTLEEPLFYDAAQKIALNAANVNKDILKTFVKYSNSIDDLCFCHGSAGVSHVFYKLGTFFQNEAILEASSYWLKETLSSLKTIELTPSNGLLEGLPGIGIVLLDRLNKIEGNKTSFNWNKPFFTDIGSNHG